MKEVDLCGHATLGSAEALWATGRVERGAKQTLSFHTKSGVLTARKVEDGWIELDFPAEPPTEVERQDNPDFRRTLEAFGAEPDEVVFFGEWMSGSRERPVHYTERPWDLPALSAWIRQEPGRPLCGHLAGEGPLHPGREQARGDRLPRRHRYDPGRRQAF